jgi:hypothetical protein
VRVRNVRTGALDHTYAAYINNGHMGESVVECGDGKPVLPASHFWSYVLFLQI